MQMQYDIRPAQAQVPEMLFDWQLDIERLEREAFAARKSGEPNDWALVEAECSLDLIDAELATIRSSRAAPDEVAATRAHLSQWRARVERVIGQLQMVGR